MSIFKDYKKYLNYQIDKAGEVYININKIEANIYNIISLNDYPDCSLSGLKLIWSYNDRNTSSIFGKGSRISVYKRLEEYSTNIIKVYNSDFSIDIYNLDATTGKYINEEEKSYIILDSYYKLYDKYGNYYKYDLSHLEYPISYFNKEDNIEINLATFTNTGKLDTFHFLNATGMELIYNNDLVRRIIIRKYLDINDTGSVGNRVTMAIDFTYSNNTISEITYNYSKDLTKTYTIKRLYDSSTGAYNIYDDVTKKCLRIVINSSKAESIKIGYLNYLGYTRTYNISYNNYYTRLYSSDFDSQSHRKIDNYYYFDNLNHFIYSYNKEGYARYNRYNSLNKSIYLSALEYTSINANNNQDIDLGNLAKNSYFNDSVNYYIASDPTKISIISTNTFPSFLGLNTLQIQGVNGFTLKQEIDISEINSSSYVLNIWYAYGNISSIDSIPEVKITFKLGSDIVDIKYIELEKIVRNASPLFLSYTAFTNQYFDKIIIEFNFSSSLIMYIKSLCLYNKSSESIINYDNNNNITYLNSGNSESNYGYNEDNKIDYSLDDESNVRKTKYYGNNIEITCNNNKIQKTKSVKNTIENEKVYYCNDISYIESKNTYYNHNNYQVNHNLLLSEEDVNNNIINYSYAFNSTNKIYDKLLNTITSAVINNTRKIEYEYDYLQRTKKIKVSNYTYPSNYKAGEIAYDTKCKLESIKSPNNMKYMYEYGTYDITLGNLTDIKYSNNGQNEIDLKQISYYRDGSINTDIIEEEIINNDTIKCEYDDYYNLDNIKINNILKHHYEYSDASVGYALLNKYHYYYNNNVLSDIYKYAFNYDSTFYINEKKIYKNNVLQETINYISDEKETKYKIYKDNSFNVLQSYDNRYLMNGYIIEAAKNYFSINELYSCFFNEEKDGQADYIKYSYLTIVDEDSIEYDIAVQNNGSGIIGKNNIISYISYPRINYAVNTNIYTIMIYFKTFEESLNKYIFSIGNSNNNNYVGIRINSSNKIELVSNDNVLISSSIALDYDSYHFACLTYDGTKYNLVLDKEKYEYNIGSVSYDSSIHFGYLYHNGTRNYFFTGEISFIAYKNSACSIDEINNYKVFLDEYIYQNIYYNENNRLYTSVDKTNLYIDYNELCDVNCDFFPLTSSLKSVKGKSIYLNTRDRIQSLNRNENFGYNKKIGGYALNISGKSLIIDLHNILGDVVYTQSHIYFDFYNVINNTNQKLFQFILGNNILSIKINSSNKLVYRLNNNTEQTSNYSIDLYEWYKVEIAYNVNTDSFLFKVNGTTVFQQTVQYGTIDESILTIGLGFYGQIRNLEVSATQSQIINDITSQAIEYNELALPITKKVLYNSSSILKHNYSYEIINGTRNSNRVAKEVINNDIYDYIYQNNNLVTVLKNNNNYKSYTYNYLDYLTQEIDYEEGIKITYSYDANGNRLSRMKLTLNNTILEEHNYLYDTTYKDRLNAIDIDGNVSYNITYMSNSPLYISHISINDTDIYISYERSNIISYSLNTDTFTFKYDDNNLRIEKRYSPNVYTNYYYDNYLLIREEIHTNNNIDNIYYLYDNNDNIYGFIYDNNIYYYIIDAFKNIIGIIDYLGQQICKYTYDGYGNLKVYENINGNYVINNSNSFIGNINSIKYKGYYYDKEIGLYYCINRYYNPYLGRWLTIDNPKYIDRYNINSLNLFAYCENNPIMGYDPDGVFDWKNFWKITLDISVDVIAALAGLIVGVSTANPIASAITISSINTAVNSIYYSFSNGNTNINEMSYHNGYISRWDRLDYVKQQTKSQRYTLNEIRYYGEYTFHMYAWIFTSKYYTGQDSDELLTQIANRAYKAEIDPYKADTNEEVAIPSYILGLWGI